MTSAWDAMDDETLLAIVAEVHRATDPPPPDLAAGVLSRLAAESLDFELLQLTESSAEATAVRSSDASGRTAQGTWTISYRGEGIELHLRIAREPSGPRLDGWVVPAELARVQVLVGTSADELAVDASGRFAWDNAQLGPCQLLIDRPHGPSVLTPPVWI